MSGAAFGTGLSDSFSFDDVTRTHYYYDKKVDRPNTTPIGQDRASQWRDVLFDPNLFEARPLSFFDGAFS